MEPVDHLSSPWAHDSSPLPSPGPPPSPAVWMPHDWHPNLRKDVSSSRNLPLIPEHPIHAGQRSHNTYSALPTHPDFLRGLQSHPLINQQADDVYLTPSTPSPTSSDEFVMTAKPEEKHLGPVPFPMSSVFSSPVLHASPRPLPSVGSSQPSVRSLPSVETSPARTPDSAAALSSSIALKSLAQPAPKPPPAMHVRPQPSPPALPKLQLRPPPEPQMQSQPPKQLPLVPPPPPLPVLQTTADLGAPSQSQSRPQINRASTAPGKNPVTAPRPRLPALRGSTGSIVLPPRTQSVESTCPKHMLFYMQEGMVVLMVEGSLYRVHKYVLEQHSDFFRGFLSDDEGSLGHSDERPIPLPENITQQGFDTLLSFLYTGIYDPISVSLSDWVTLLRISTLLQFNKVRQYAVRELTTRRTSLAPIEAILLAKEHDIPTWLGPAYAELVRRPSSLDDEEAERLGARLTAQVGRARELLRQEDYAQYHQRRYGARYTPPERLDEQLVARAVNEVFKLPGVTADAP